jgi:dTDP-4-dehydrorhamnose 3,5-epimerase
MNKINTPFDGLYIIENNKIFDDRGWFEKKYHAELMSDISPIVGEVYTSMSNKNVLRGLHFQRGHKGQSKLVTCLAGSFIDIAVDLRKEKSTFGQVFTYKLDSRGSNSVFIPKEFAHGIFALEDNSILLNIAGSVYSPGDEGGILWSSLKELSFVNNPLLSDKDANLPSWEEIVDGL